MCDYLLNKGVKGIVKVVKRISVHQLKTKSLISGRLFYDLGYIDLTIFSCPVARPSILIHRMGEMQGMRFPAEINKNIYILLSI